MKIWSDELKAAQAAHYLLTRWEGTHDYGSVVKLLYLSSRKMLLETGSSMFHGEEFFSMNDGMIMSKILAFCRMKATGVAGHPWGDYVEPPKGKNISAKSTIENNLGQLTGYEIGLLDKIFKTHGHKDFEELSAESHDLPEFKKPKNPTGRIQVFIDDILEKGKAKENIKETAREEKAYNQALSKIFP